MTTQEAKQKIDDSSYERLLSHWWYAPAGDPMFVGEIGEYYTKVMSEKRQAVGPGAAVAASKAIVWDAP